VAPIAEVTSAIRPHRIWSVGWQDDCRAREGQQNGLHSQRPPLRKVASACLWGNDEVHREARVSL